MAVSERKAKKSNKVAPSSTQKCLQNLLTMAQTVGAFPVSNIREDRPEKLSFKWLSWKMLYTVLTSFVYLFCATCAFYKALTEGIFLNQLISPLFYFQTFITSVFFTKLAMHWPRFMTKWSRLEDHILSKYNTQKKLYKKINCSAFIMILVALAEHSLSVTNAVYSSNCQNDSTGWEHYFKKQFHFIFRYMPYSFFVGMALTIDAWIATFVWNLGDIFIILVSMIMTERFHQINQRIKAYSEEINGKPLLGEGMANFIKVYHTEFSKADYKFWRKIREDYDKMTEIIHYLDQILSNLVLSSYACNLTFILIQLFNSLRQMESAIEGFYFFYSFCFVILRIIVVSIFGASINEESRAAVPYLNAIPTEYYNEEIQRLITQVHVDCAALTGHNFFRITKGLVLSVAAAIITYELVLIQFNQTTLNKYMSANETICY